MTLEAIAAIIIFVITYIFIMSEWMNKMTAALMGGFTIILLGIISQEEAFRFIDWNVIFLLVGMMMVMGVLKETGVFQYIAIKTAKLAKGSPVRILIFISFVTALISAFLDNVTTVMIIIPVVILIAQELEITPVPFIICQAIASNIGGTATLIGDPPNILIGSSSGLSFMDFLVNLAPAILLVLLATLLLFYLMFRKKLVVSNVNKARIMEFNTTGILQNHKLLWQSGIVMTLLISGFMLQEVIHTSSATLAMVAAAILLLANDRKHVEKVLTHDVDWATILFFIGLFMIVGGLQVTGVLLKLATAFLAATHNDLQLTSISMVWLSGMLSAVIDNVPFVATMIPMIKSMGTLLGHGDINPLWWALSLGACLGGNGTLIGASANIISVGISRKNGYPISFMDFFKYSFVTTLVSLGISSLYIYVRYFLLAG